MFARAPAATCRRTMPRYGIRIGAVADRSQRLGGAALHDRLGIVERLQQCWARRGISRGGRARKRPSVAPRPLRRPADARERLNARGQADAPDRQRSTTTGTRLGIAEQTNEIGRWRRSDDLRLRPRSRPQDHRRGRIGIAQQALILEPNDPSELLFPSDRPRTAGDGSVGCRGGGQPTHTRQ